MKRLIMLFTMLFCFSIAGICKTTIDLSENSKQKIELVSFSDVVKADAVLVSAALKANVSLSYGSPSIISDITCTYTYTNSIYLGSPKNEVLICIRNEIRIS
ncbi:hypothetical protein [Myroides sp. NP-2]|uniref:hypothetical protein n=1 Tax=Myroides sp. NP-2 TaxID=2759945 RepID=UPI0015FA317C|nr:hypothetical protein [Myroides sp. NP-2]